MVCALDGRRIRIPGRRCAVPDNISAGTSWLTRSRQRFADGKAIQWSIDRTGVSDAIGTITLSFDTTDAETAATKTASLGFVLARAHWGEGLASEAAREVLRYAVDDLAFARVMAEAVARNFASLRILAKLGFAPIESYIDESDGERCCRLCDYTALPHNDGQDELFEQCF